MRERGVRKIDLAECHTNHTPAKVESRLGRGVRAVKECGRDAERAKALEGSGVEHHRSGGLEGMWTAIDHSHARTVGGRLKGRGQSGWASPNHQHFGGGDHAALTRTHHASSAVPVVSMSAGSASTSSRCSPGSTL